MIWCPPVSCPPRLCHPGAAGQNGAAPSPCPGARALTGTLAKEEGERRILIFKIATSFQNEFFLPPVLQEFYECKAKLSFSLEKQLLNEKFHQGTTWILLGINYGVFPQSFCSSSPPLIQPKNGWSYKKIFFFGWEQTLPLHVQTMRLSGTTTYPTLSWRYKNLADSKQFHQNNSFRQIPISLIVKDNNISDNAGSKYFGKFSGHSLSNLQLRTLNVHSYINKSALLIWCLIQAKAKGLGV